MRLNNLKKSTKDTYTIMVNIVSKNQQKKEIKIIKEQWI